MYLEIFLFAVLAQVEIKKRKKELVNMDQFQRSLI